MESLGGEIAKKDQRVDQIINNFTNMLFKGISNSLFEKDKLLFSFLVYLKTLECEHQTN